MLKNSYKIFIFSCEIFDVRYNKHLLKLFIENKWCTLYFDNVQYLWTILVWIWCFLFIFVIKQLNYYFQILLVYILLTYFPHQYLVSVGWTLPFFSILKTILLLENFVKVDCWLTSHCRSWSTLLFNLSRNSIFLKTFIVKS